MASAPHAEHTPYNHTKHESHKQTYTTDPNLSIFLAGSYLLAAPKPDIAKPFLGKWSSLAPGHASNLVQSCQGDAAESDALPKAAPLSAPWRRGAGRMRKIAANMPRRRIIQHYLQSKFPLCGSSLGWLPLWLLPLWVPQALHCIILLRNMSAAALLIRFRS